MSEKDLGVTGQPAPPTPLTDEFATDWLIVDFDAAARTAMDLATNPRVSAKLELLRGHIFAIAQTYHEQMRGDYRKHPEAAAQPLTPPQPHETCNLVMGEVYRCPACDMPMGSLLMCLPTCPIRRAIRINLKNEWGIDIDEPQAAPPSLTAQQVQDVTVSPESSAKLSPFAAAKGEYSRPDSASLTAEELGEIWRKSRGLPTAYESYFLTQAKEVLALPGIKVVRG